MENVYGFSDSDSLEERRDKVTKAMEDPAFIEKINSTVVIDVVTDGQREYDQSDIKTKEILLKQSTNEGILLEPGEFKDVLGQELAQATDYFTKPGSIKMTGEQIVILANYLASICFENGLDDKQLGEMVEAIVAGALGIGFSLDFAKYQTDITLSGQGLMTDTYLLDIQFRPVHKKIASG